jgi:hypothetical protein
MPLVCDYGECQLSKLKQTIEQRDALIRELVQACDRALHAFEAHHSGTGDHVRGANIAELRNALAAARKVVK